MRRIDMKNGAEEEDIETKKPEQNAGDDEFTKVLAHQAAQSPEALNSAMENIKAEADEFNLTHEGLAASKNLAEYDRRCKMADAEARQTFRDDPHGYAIYRQMTVTNNDRERKAIVSSVMAEMKHGAQVAMKNDTEIRSQQLARVDMLAAAGRLANTSADMEIAADASNGLLEQTDTEHEAALDKLKERRKEELAKAKTEAERKAAEDRFATAKAGIDTAVVAARTAIGKQTVDGITGIKNQDEAWARGRATTLRQDFRNIFMQRYKAHLAMNQSHELAWANATAATRAAAIEYFKTRIEAGQISSVMYTLDELEKSGDEAYRRTVTKENPTGTYDPSAYSFCRKSDLTALRKAAIAQVEEQRTLRNRQLVESQRSVKLEEQALLDDITKHSIGVADDGETPLYKTEEDRMKAQKLLYDRAKALEKRAGAVGYSVRKVFRALANEPRKYLAMKERSERIAKKALGQKYVREQEEMVQSEILDMLKTATTGGEVEIDVPVKDESGKDGTVKMRVDVHRAIVDAIDCARANGICKGEQFTMIRNEHLNSKRYMKIIEDAANKYFSFGTEGTVLGRDGKWGDRASGSTTRIYLSEGDGGSFKADNVRSNMRVKVNLNGKPADVDWSMFDTTDRYVNADTLNQIIKAGKEYLDSKLNPTAEDFDLVFGKAIREAVDKDNLKSFQGDTLDTVRRNFNSVFEDHEETFGVWRNGLNTTFFGAPIGTWNSGGQTQRITVAGERRWQDIRQIIPLAQKLRNEKLKNAIIDAQYDESQGRDVDEQIRDLLDGGETEE